MFYYFFDNSTQIRDTWGERTTIAEFSSSDFPMEMSILKFSWLIKLVENDPISCGWCHYWVLGLYEKASWANRGKQVNIHVPLWSLFQFLTPGFCLRISQGWSVACNGKMNPFSIMCFWSLFYCSNREENQKNKLIGLSVFIWRIMRFTVVFHTKAFHTPLKIKE